VLLWRLLGVRCGGGITTKDCGINRGDNRRKQEIMRFQKGQSGNPNGRPIGSLNVVTRILKEQILEALDRQGGIEYLQWLARTNSSAFVSLLSKVLPTTVEGEGHVTITLEERIVRPGELAPVVVNGLTHTPSNRLSGPVALGIEDNRDDS
jgi:Family of unknown function (DUF5681)